jgi:type II secretory pathway pseudopilin PulG
MQLQGQAGKRDGYAMAALLVGLAVMAILLSVAMPTWRQMVQREKEAELIFRGQQYARAIGLFQRQYAATFPPDVDALVRGKFLRKKYKDPMVADGEFQVLYQVQQAPGTQQGGRGGAGSGIGSSTRVGSGSAGSGLTGPRGGVIGVASKSTEASIRIYNGRTHYNEWQFIYSPALMQPGRGGQPGVPGRGVVPGGRGPGGGMGPGRGTGPGGMGPGRGMGPGGMGPGRGGGRGPGG